MSTSGSILLPSLIPASGLWWPLLAGQLGRQLSRLDGINQRFVELPRQQFKFFRRSEDQPEHILTRVVEDLPELAWSHEHAAVFGHSKRMVSNAHAALPFQH